MRGVIYVLVVGLLMGASSVVRADGHGATPYYLVVGVGTNRQSDSFVFAGDTKNEDTSGQSEFAMLGMQLNRNLSVEAGGINFGAVELHGADLTSGTVLGREVTLETDAELAHRSWGYKIGGRYRIQLSGGYTSFSTVYLYVRGGELRWSRKAVLDGVGRLSGVATRDYLSYAEAGNDSYYGAGLYFVVGREHATETAIAFDYSEYDLGGFSIPNYMVHLVYEF